jgi:hypothetical protein
VGGDAVAAAVLAGAGADAAGALVRINLVELPEDDRHRLASDLLGDATERVERAPRVVGSHSASHWAGDSQLPDSERYEFSGVDDGFTVLVVGAEPHAVPVGPHRNRQRVTGKCGPREPS